MCWWAIAWARWWPERQPSSSQQTPSLVSSSWGACRRPPPPRLGVPIAAPDPALGRAADVRAILLLLTLAGPPGVPGFVPPHAFTRLLGTNLTSSAASRLAGIPRASIVAGHADLMLPYTWAARLPMAGEVRASTEVQVSMEDVPGVWTGAGHKVGGARQSAAGWQPLNLHPGAAMQAVVSCNQLVRRVVPLLADVARLAVEQQAPAGLGAAAVLPLLQQRLTADVAPALWPASSWQAEPAAGCLGDQHPAHPAALAPVELVARHLAADQVLTWQWSRHEHWPWAGMLVIAAGRSPCSQLDVTASSAQQRAAPAAHALFATLPPLLPSLRQGGGEAMPWLRLVEGVDWLENATRLAYVPLPHAGDAMRLAVAGAGDPNSSVAVWVQPVEKRPQDILVQLPRAGAVRLPQQHAALLRLGLPAPWRQPYGSGLAAHLLALTLGRAPPLSLGVEAAACRPASGEEPAEYLVPAVVATDGRDRAHADIVRVARRGLVQLWSDGMPSRSHLLLVSDPRCEYWLRCARPGLRQALLPLPAARREGTALCSPYLRSVERNLRILPCPAVPPRAQPAVGCRGLAGALPAAPSICGAPCGGGVVPAGRSHGAVLSCRLAVDAVCGRPGSLGVAAPLLAGPGSGGAAAGEAAVCGRGAGPPAARRRPGDRR